MAEFSRLLSDRCSIRKCTDEKVDVALGREIRDTELLETVGLSEAVVAPILLGRPAAIPKAPARKDPEIVKTIG